MSSHGRNLPLRDVETGNVAQIHVPSAWKWHFLDSPWIQRMGEFAQQCGAPHWGSPGLPDSPDSTVKMRGKHPRPWASYSQGKNPRRGRFFGLVPVGPIQSHPHLNLLGFARPRRAFFPGRQPYSDRETRHGRASVQMERVIRYKTGGTRPWIWGFCVWYPHSSILRFSIVSFLCLCH